MDAIGWCLCTVESSDTFMLDRLMCHLFGQTTVAKQSVISVS